MTPSPQAQTAPRRSRPLSAVLGLVLALAGAGVLVGLFVIVYGESEALRRYAIELGLAGATLVSALAQTALLVGLWLVWRSTRRR